MLSVMLGLVAPSLPAGNVRVLDSDQYRPPKQAANATNERRPRNSWDHMKDTKIENRQAIAKAIGHERKTQRQLVEATGLCKSTVCIALAQMVAENSVDRHNTFPLEYSIQLSET